MTIYRSTNAIKHLKHRSANTGSAINRAINALVGGAKSADSYALDDDQTGAPLSGLEIVEYIPAFTGTYSVPDSGYDITVGVSTGGLLSMKPGAWIQFDRTGDQRGISVEEDAYVVVYGADAADADGVNSSLRLWAWTNDNYTAGSGQQPSYKITTTAAGKPVSHAVLLASAERGDENGPHVWREEDPISNNALSDQIVDSREGLTRDFMHIAANYHDLHTTYRFMTFQDFGFMDGQYGGWKIQSGDQPKVDNSKRGVYNTSGAQVVVESLPFDTALFDQGGGTFYQMTSVRCVWLAESIDGDGELVGDIVYSGVNIKLYEDGGDPGAPFVQFNSGAHFDADIGSPFDLETAFRIRCEVGDNIALHRMILLISTV